MHDVFPPLDDDDNSETERENTAQLINDEAWEQACQRGFVEEESRRARQREEVRRRAEGLREGRQRAGERVREGQGLGGWEGWWNGREGGGVLERSRGWVEGWEGVLGGDGGEGDGDGEGEDVRSGV